jgi:uncharacterized protein YndB with AHSA1/START domain
MCKTIKQKVQFKAPPRSIYELLTDSKKHRAFSGHKATLSTHAGGMFSAYSGHIQGLVVDLAPAKRIVLAWRTRKFPEGIFSMAAFTLARKKNGGTELVLTHRGVPKNLLSDIDSGWRKHYWKKMKSYLGE